MTAETGKGIALRVPRRERFCREFVIDLSAKQAAIRAGYSPRTSKQTGHELLQMPSVAARIAELQADITDRLEITAERVLREAARLAFSDPRKFFNADGSLKQITELDDDTAAALGSFESVERAIPGGERATAVTRKYRAWDKAAALTVLAKHLGLLVEKIDVGGDLAAALDRARSRGQSRLG